MNVLLVGMNFHDYDDKIKKGFEDVGHKVFLVKDTKKSKSRFISDEQYKKQNLNHQRKILTQIKDFEFNEVIVIVGRYLTEEFLLGLRNLNKNARFVLYLWDDVERIQNFNIVKKFYDTIFSFDSIDCEKYGFNFLPLFYLDDFCLRDSNNKSIDIYGSYWLHSDRINIIKKIAETQFCKNRYFYILTGRFYYFKYFFRLICNKKYGIHYSIFSLPLDKNVKNMKRAFSVLDIQFPSQKGLTLRTIEALASKCKIITTNLNIKNYDFYDEQNVCIIDRKNPEIPESFFSSPYKELPREIYDKYSLSKWCDVIIQG
ncbi:MAG: hypothetical protein J6K22_11395 [Spirochaetaceae bacterium]|nr:hypothetical protein [Treponema sp.]MBP3451055.1 hypothetical protein [Spirochaetaceae bacterium]